MSADLMGPLEQAGYAQGAADAAARIEELESLLRTADNYIVWEMHMLDGQEFQLKVERVLGIGKQDQKSEPAA